MRGVAVEGVAGQEGQGRLELVGEAADNGHHDQGVTEKRGAAHVTEALPHLASQPASTRGAGRQLVGVHGPKRRAARRRTTRR